MTPQDLHTLDRLVTPATPTSFDTRNLGGTLEAEPALSEDRSIIDLRIAPNLCWHTGNTVWIERKDSLGNVVKVQMPLMDTLRMETSLSLKPGKPVLAGVLSPKDGEGNTDFARKVMVFVKANVLEVK